MTTATYSLKVCQDCYAVVANGFDGLDLSVEREADITAGLNFFATKGAQLVNGSDDFGFCRSDCDLCGTGFAGERFEVVGLTNEVDS